MCCPRSQPELGARLSVTGGRAASFAVHERQPLWRQIVGRTGAMDGIAPRDMLYWIEPKSAHTTIVGHLMTSWEHAAFDKADERWDSRHRVATTEALTKLGAKAEGAEIWLDPRLMN